MNYYYDLPIDIINKIENIVKEEELNLKIWNEKIHIVNTHATHPDFALPFGRSGLYYDRVWSEMTYQKRTEYCWGVKLLMVGGF